jgi:hypothetical protein
MNRRSLLACGLGALALAPTGANATSPDPIYVQPQAIVLLLRIVTADKDYHKLIPREEMQTRLISHVSSELSRDSLKIPVFDANKFHQPDDMPSDFILRIDCRVDLTSETAEAGDAEAETLGVVSVTLRRGESNLLSGEPFTFFRTKKDAANLIPSVEGAARDALNRSVIQFIVMFN